MSKRKLIEQLIPNIDENIQYIENSDNYYISINGNVYVKYEEGFLKKKLYLNPYNQYVYCGIKYQNKMISKRVHRLVAQAFIPNPNNFPVVGHLDNIKSHNTVDNLYWTTISDNTQKAFDDGLAQNAKGFEDSQSHPVVVYDQYWVMIDICGSCIEASKKYNVAKSTVCRQCKNGVKTKSRSGYYFRYLSSLTTIENIGSLNLPEEVSRVVSSYFNEHQR